MLRRISVLFALTIALLLSSVTTPAHAASTVDALIIGDSIAQGCCATVPSNRIGGVIQTKLGWRSMTTDGKGGTGYLTKGTQTGVLSYQNRISATMDSNPGKEVILVIGGNNDTIPVTDKEKSNFRGAVHNTYTIIGAKKGAAKVYIIGQYSPTGKVNATKEAIIKDEAARHGFKYIEGSGTWFATAKQSGWLWTDNFHPDSTGHYVLGAHASRALIAFGAPR